ncbi:MAG: hypothetical protein HOG03_05250 [Desulfobacula sp.]|jgi:hypothetical protein|uniref:hypothetical protein n=1 Tax=Desulfobacula sp. TaxID=2593537 RepID=UPI001DCECD93|nr:hypothetical protein [Desulfobacula sp.]MBT3484620.1 hypothetical protein [Desulfobacula sp.]MBT3803990.1 hypothetical protein [Desulfobacula sp.]MBT4023605.1 hypothetical protein [Desulfobacula sp.]MBT4197727.1 hypothetical protein [Desulfobacula sp.]
MKDKKKTIKTIALALISIIFLFMLYNTFFKSKKNSNKTSIKKQSPEVTAIRPEQTIPMKTDEVILQATGTDSEGNIDFSIPGFKPDINNIFKPFVKDKPVPKKEQEMKKPNPDPKPISDIIKKLVKIIDPPFLSDQEKMNISQDLNFKGSILSSKSAVAIINDEFIHVGDSVNGYKVASISEQQVTIDTGRGTIILEIMTHE